MASALVRVPSSDPLSAHCDTDAQKFMEAVILDEEKWAPVHAELCDTFRCKLLDVLRQNRDYPFAHQAAWIKGTRHLALAHTNDPSGRNRFALGAALGVAPYTTGDANALRSAVEAAALCIMRMAAHARVRNVYNLEIECVADEHRGCVFRMSYYL